MRLYFILILIYAISTILPHNIIASDTDYYTKILQYGTDSDITNAFYKVYEDLGREVNEAVFVTFDEPHSDKMRLSIIRYLSMVAGSSNSEAEGGNFIAERTSRILKREIVRSGVSVDYQEEVVTAAGQVKAMSCVEPMITLFQSKETPKRIKLAIVDAWGRIGDRKVEVILVGVLQDDYSDSDLKARAVRALGEMESEESIEIIAKIVNNTYEPKILRMYAVLALSKLGKESVLDTLEKLLYDSNNEVAEYAARGIADIGCERCGEILMKALRSDYDKVRYYAVIGLSRLRYTDSMEILKFKAEYDVNERVREEAKRAVASLTDNIEGDEN